MVRSYLKVAIRNLMKQPVLAAINMLGLSIGIACFSLVLFYASNELSFDNFHAHGGHLYRVFQRSLAGDNKEQNEIYLPMPLAPAMKQDIAGVANFVRLKEPWDDNVVKSGDQIFQMPVTYADPSFFDVFSFELKSGSPSSVLKDPHGVVLSERAAITLFGETNPIDKLISIKIDDEFEQFIITGIAENVPSNSSIQFSILASFEYLATTRNGMRSVNNWNRPANISYVQLDAGSAVDENTLQQFYGKYHSDEGTNAGHHTPETVSATYITYGLQPITQIHTDVEFKGARLASIDPKNIWILVGVSGGLLFIACINFTTLAIARSVNRSREVGIRKVLGSNRKMIIGQFISEAVVMSFLAACIGLLVAALLLPYFNRLSGRALTASIAELPAFTLSMVLLSIAVGLLSGSYPAIVLSRFRPAAVLKQRSKIDGPNFFTRSLITFQFVLSTALITSTSIMLRQIRYVTETSPGFQTQNIVVVNGDKVNAGIIYPLFKDAALRHFQVTGVAGAGLAFGEGSGWNRHNFQHLGARKEVYSYFVDTDFVPLMDIQLLVGRNFDDRIFSDAATSVIINEAMVRDLGWTIEHALGQELVGYHDGTDLDPPVVIGVVKNFHFRSRREEISPQLFHRFPGNAPNRYFVRLKPGSPVNTLMALEAAWKSLVPEMPFRYSFLDEDLDRFYVEEQRWSDIVGWAGGISIFLASTGLFGLVALATTNKAKEISIRKVLGGSVRSIVCLLSKDFLKLVMVALIIALPLALYCMNRWLENFAYRVDISFGVLLGSCAIVVGVAVLTVGLFVVKAAIVNPVTNLRSE